VRFIWPGTGNHSGFAFFNDLPRFEPRVLLPIGFCGLGAVERMRLSAASARAVVSCSLSWSASFFAAKGERYHEHRTNDNRPHNRIVGLQMRLLPIAEDTIAGARGGPPPDPAEIEAMRIRQRHCAQIAGSARKLDAYISLARFRGIPKKLTAELCDFAKDSVGLAEQRNRFVHDVWIFPPKGPERMEATAKKKARLVRIPTSTEELFKFAPTIFQHRAVWAAKVISVGLEMVPPMWRAAAARVRPASRARSPRH
jgi:hypothetical protein